MINLTVKTLDSQNHAFCVEDEITIAEFKESIAFTVNIPADTQRLIYCGRVLQDSAKLKDYDVDGKVIHLVQRPPPSSVLRPDAPEPPPQPHRRVRGLEYVGTVRLPVSGIENTLHSLPIHSLANSRLNVARRMISRAENVINALENPNRQEQPTQNEPQEEATPVFEARVVLPGARAFNGSETSFDNNAPLPGDSTIPPQGVLIPENIESIVDPLINGSSNVERPYSISSTPEVITPPLARSTENLSISGNEPTTTPGESTTITSDGETSTNDTTNNGNGTATTSTNSTGNGSRTSDFADILDSLNRVHTRFVPYMDQLTTFMRDDPVVPQQNFRSTQAMINRVSEVCHYLGHAYHSISDIILRVRTAPPRQLLCRPMLIQHSAVVQVDIPIQVEAQVHLPTDRNPSSTTPTTGASTTSSTTPSTGTTTSTTAAPASNAPDTSSLNSVLGIPFMPRSGVRVETYRLPLFNNNNTTASSFRTNLNPSTTDAYVAAIRSLDPRGRGPLNTTTTATSASGGQAPVQPMDVASAIASSVVNSLNSATTNGGSGASSINVSRANGPGEPNNPNVEFFMEVTPESITIDSLETAFVGSGQASNLNAILQESINPTPPEFIQSIMQMAGQLINRSNLTGNVQVQTSAASTPGAPSTTESAPSAPPLDVTNSSTADTSVTTSVGAARTTPFQNSQARGNTQTQPTTATHTRSTPRPHVHLAQHTMHAFDPFLPCNSHHVLTRRRLYNANNTAPQPNTTAQNTGSISQEVPVDLNDESPVYSIIRNLLSSVRSSMPTTYSQNSQTTSTGNSNVAAAQDLMSAAAAWLSTMPESNYMDRRPTIARILQQFPDSSYVEGESIFTDLVMLLARGFTIGDIMHIVRGHLEPLIRIGPELRNFVVRRILNEDITDLGYERGVEKLLSEMHSFIDHLGVLETRDNIDIVRSVQALLRARLPNIITLVLSDNQNSTRLMFEQIRTTVQQLGALLVKASRNGTDGVQRVCEAFLMRFMDGVPLDLQQWSIQSTRPQITEFINTLDVPESLLQRYIVRHIDPIITPSATVESNTSCISEPEPMQVEEIVENSTTTDEEVTPDLQLSDSESVGTVVLGSAPWHAQVPSDWVPIIVRDSQRQRRQNHQPPFSDAYLSGMPSKRRKLADCNRPSSNISQVISESVRRAVTATGLTTVAPIETVTQAASTDVAVQAAYRDLLHNRVQSELGKNEDFTPEQFPNVDNYFNNPRQ